jgi:hypothetical protein
MSVEVQTGDQPIVIEAHSGGIHTRLGRADDPDATLTGPPKPIMGLLLGFLELADAKARGITCRGDPKVLDRIRAHTGSPIELAG